MDLHARSSFFPIGATNPQRAVYPRVVDEWSMSFTMTPRIVRVIRRQANCAMDLLHWGGDQDAALLVVSELTTNAILHTRPSVPTGLLWLKLATLADGGLMVDVSDPMPGMPERREDDADVDREGGYGLVLVRCVASLSWAPEKNGKTVRAVLPVTH